VAVDKHTCHARPCGTDASDNQTMGIKDPTIFVPLFLVGGSILLGMVLTILNSMVSIDPGLLFALMFNVILATWSALNRWEGDQQLRRIQSESCSLGPDAADQKRRNLDLDEPGAP